MKIGQILRTIFPVFLLSILLPTVDVYSDLNLIYKLYVGTYSCNPTPEMKKQWERYENCLTTYYWCHQCPHPRTLNDSRKLFEDYDLCWQDSFEYCTSNNNRTEVFCSKTIENHPRSASSLLSFFMINYLVCMLTFFRLERDRIKLFIFPLLNLYPQYVAFKVIKSFLRETTEGMKNRRNFEKDVALHETFLEAVPTSVLLTVLLTKVTTSDLDYTTLEFIIIKSSLLFFLTYTTSIFSASLGLAKCLKYGVARPIRPGGSLDGLLTARFLLAFISCAICLITKSVCLGFLINEDWSKIQTALIFSALWLPQAILAVCTTLDIRNRNSLKILITHPSLILLPIITVFTFRRMKDISPRDIRIKFSTTYTWINFAISLIGFVGFYVLFHVSQHQNNILYFIFFFFPSFVLLLIFLIPFQLLDHEMIVYDPENPDQRFIYKDMAVIEDTDESPVISNNNQIEQNDQN